MREKGTAPKRDRERETQTDRQTGRQSKIQPPLCPLPNPASLALKFGRSCRAPCRRFTNAVILLLLLLLLLLLSSSPSSPSPAIL
jgi:hypothetical protein